MDDGLGPKYIITDGTLVLDIYDGEDGYFAVQGTFDRSLTTQGRTLKEVFEMARDAAATLALPDDETADAKARASDERTAGRVETSSAA